MKTLFGLVVVAALAYGGYRLFHTRSHAEQVHQACVNIASMCSNGEATQRDIDECIAGWQETPPADITPAVDKFITCTADANSCGEIAGCLVGAGAGVDHDLKDFGKGFDRVRKH